MARKQQLEVMVADLIEGGMPSTEARQAAEIAVYKGYRKFKTGTWTEDTEYKSKNRIKYHCSVCGGYHMSKRWEKTNVFYMRYCPICGSRNKGSFGADENKEEQ